MYKSLLEQCCPQFACFKCSSVYGFLLLQVTILMLSYTQQIFFEHLPRAQSCAHACSREIGNSVLALVEVIVLLKR